MKKAINILIGILVGILVLGGAFYTFITVRGIPSYEVNIIEDHVQSTPERVERGAKLASVLCASCHINRQTGRLSGKPMLEAPKEFGPIHSPNITKDMENGIGSWTDGELEYLLRTGIKRDGVYAPPYMAKLPHMADEDLYSIIAFLRSDHPMVDADPAPSIPSEPSFLTKFLCFVAFKPFLMPEEFIDMPDTNNAVEFGKYLTTNLECFSCHSTDFKTNNYLNPEQSEGYFGGGNKPLNEEGEVVLTQNLTPHETGIGNWTKDSFIQALKYGRKEGEPALRYPMLPYTQLTDKEAGAIYEYLMTIPPIDNLIRRPDL